MKSSKIKITYINYKNPSEVLFFLLLLAGIMGSYGTADLSKATELLHSIFTAVLVGCIIYLVTSYLPEIQRKRRLVRSLRRQYHTFKVTCIDLFLMASGSQNYPNKENLLNHREFKRYFSDNVNDSQTRWHLVATHVDDGGYIFKELLFQFDFLINETQHMRSSIDIYDDKIDQTLTNFHQMVLRFKATESGTDDYKPFCRTLWSIFSRWNYTTGQEEDDFFEVMIDKLEP